MASASAPRATVDRPSATSTAATNTTPPTAASGGADPPNESNTSSRGDGAGTGEGGAGGGGASAGTSTPLDGPAPGGRRASGAGWVEVEEGVIEILDDEGEGEGDGDRQLSPTSEAQAMALVVLQFDVGLEADTALRALNATAEPGNTASMCADTPPPLAEPAAHLCPGPAQASFNPSECRTFPAAVATGTQLSLLVRGQT